MPRDTKLQISKKCPFCKLKFFKSESYENHLKLHKGETFKCDLCNKSISSKYHLKIHRETHSNKKYPCNFTGNKYIINILKKYLFKENTRISKTLVLNFKQNFWF